MPFVEALTLKKGDYYIKNYQSYRIVEITWLSHGKLVQYGTVKTLI